MSDFSKRLLEQMAKKIRLQYPWIDAHKKTISEFVEQGDVRTIVTINRKEIIAKSRKNIEWRNSPDV